MLCGPPSRSGLNPLQSVPGVPGKPKISSVSAPVPSLVTILGARSPVVVGQPFLYSLLPCFF